MKKIIAAAVLLSVPLFYSCEKETIIPDIPDTVLFSTDIVPMFNDRCVACHGTGSATGLDLNEDVAYDNLYGGGYIEPGNPENSALYQKVGAGNHGSLSSVQKTKLYKWIEQGGLDN